MREAWLDGQWVYPLPLDASKLSLGKHTWELNITDSAGNGNKVKFTFLVVTSIADLDALSAKYGTAGTIPAATVTSLRAKIAEAKTAADAGDNAGAIARLGELRGQIDALSNADARNTLITDNNDVIRQLRGIPGDAAPTDLGITQAAAAGAPRHLFVPPSVPVRNASPAFKVLVFSNRQGDGSFRHPAIEDAEVAIQELGRKYNFDVDVWDPQYPNAGPSDTPFTSAANLAQYKVIIGDSSVGNNVLNTAYRMKDGTVVNEQTAFQQFIQAGGGYVALHAANDSLHNFAWYKDFLGGLFVSHPANAERLPARLRLLLLGRAQQRGSVAPVDGRRRRPEDGRGRGRALPLRPQAAPVQPRPADAQRGHLPRRDGRRHATRATSRTATTRSSGARTTTAAVSGRRCSATTATCTACAWFRESIYQGILTAGGMKYANCVTHTEVKTLLSKLQASGGITADAATQGTALVQSAFDKYYTLDKAQIGASIARHQRAAAIWRTTPASGDAASRAKVLAKAQELKSGWACCSARRTSAATVGGTVPATLSLSLGSPRRRSARSRRASARRTRRARRPTSSRRRATRR